MLPAKKLRAGMQKCVNAKVTYLRGQFYKLGKKIDFFAFS